MVSFFQVKSFLSYWLNSVDEHSLHSPFFYDFYTKVVKKKPAPYDVAERLRQQLVSSKKTIAINDLGAGSVLSSTNRAINDIARVSVSPAKYGMLYNRCIEHFRCKYILELGTSLGINTLYLSRNKDSIIHTFEGSSSIAEIALDTFEFAGASNINLIQGNIDDTLKNHLRTNRKIDFAFVDANHRYEAVLDYVGKLLNASHEKTVIVIDDIHLNGGMERAWNELKMDHRIHATADLYRCGFLFLDPTLNHQHWVLQF